ncbi:methanethiol S-methyltransferase [Pseudorhodoferax sp.]|uniref:methanethiol S-methyltransferase n=1 Tax=Pseudorhodoferax sp. TaxID=1993553 RepID=UPI0039E2677B
MRTLFSILYGLLAYLACMATLLYFIGFSGNLLVPRSVDVGASAGLFEALGTDALLLLLFGVQHSVMARRGFKRWWTQVVPAAVERSTFVVASCVALALLFRFWVPIGTPVVWRVAHEGAAALLWGLFALGWLVALVSTFLLDHFALFGLRQVFAAGARGAAPPDVFRTPLFYRYVRHPLYLGFLLGLWAVPVMTFGHLLFALGLSAYILVGIAFEECDLLLRFGERYRAYRRQVGMLVPRIAARADRAGR